MMPDFWSRKRGKEKLKDGLEEVKEKYSKQLIGAAPNAVDLLSAATSVAHMEEKGKEIVWSLFWGFITLNVYVASYAIFMYMFNKTLRVQFF